MSLESEECFNAIGNVATLQESCVIGKVLQCIVSKLAKQPTLQRYPRFKSCVCVPRVCTVVEAKRQDHRNAAL